MKDKAPAEVFSAGASDVVFLSPISVAAAVMRLVLMVLAVVMARIGTVKTAVMMVVVITAVGRAVVVMTWVGAVRVITIHPADKRHGSCT